MAVLYLVLYVALIALGTVILKASTSQLDAFQITYLYLYASLFISVPLMLLVHRTLSIPKSSLPLGLGVVSCFTVAGLLYTLALKSIPLTIAAPVATTYVIPVVLLSILFLGETMTLVKGAGMLITLLGVGILLTAR